eukprot:1016921-Prymnesium_polylepis.1
MGVWGEFCPAPWVRLARSSPPGALLRELLPRMAKPEVVPLPREDSAVLGRDQGTVPKLRHAAGASRRVRVRDRVRVEAHRVEDRPHLLRQQLAPQHLVLGCSAAGAADASEAQQIRRAERMCRRHARQQLWRQRQELCRQALDARHRAGTAGHAKRDSPTWSHQ